MSSSPILMNIGVESEKQMAKYIRNVLFLNAFFIDSIENPLRNLFILRT